MGSIKDTLERSDLFKGLSSDELDMLVPLCREEVYEVGAIIFPEGAPCYTIYVVASGKVALEMKLRISRASEETVTTHVVTEGGCLCYSGLIDPSILTASGRSLETTRLIGLDAAELKSLFEENHQLEHKTMSNLLGVVSLRLQYTKETMGHILSIAFHDLKAPLAAVESYHRVMLSGFAGELSEEQRNMLQRSSKRILELLNLIDNILDISRIDARDLKRAKISLAEVIENCIETMRPLAEEKGLQLKAEVPEGIPLILGARDRLQQVVTNLLANAIKFTPAGGTVEVKMREEDDYIQAEITDTGIGIPAEELPMIFDDFYRGLSSTEKGAGLGLSIARRIIEAHGGTIRALSPCPGSDRGSEFIFTLPKDLSLFKEEGEKGKLSYCSIAQERGEMAKILVVDDDPDILVAVSSVLKSRSYEVVIAHDGEEALAKLREEKPDLMLLDLPMPKMDGFAVCRELQNDDWKEHRNIPILITSSVREEASRRRYELETGSDLAVNGYIEKPIEPHILLERVEKLLAKGA